MLLHHALRINYTLNMDNKDIREKPLATIVTTSNKKKCKCCGKELPLSYFRKYA